MISLCVETQKKWAKQENKTPFFVNGKESSWEKRFWCQIIWGPVWGLKINKAPLLLKCRLQSMKNCLIKVNDRTIVSIFIRLSLSNRYLNYFHFHSTVKLNSTIVGILNRYSLSLYCLLCSKLFTIQFYLLQFIRLQFAWP